jgi:hypothetical protein
LEVVFEANARQQLLEHLQFPADEIQEAANVASDDNKKTTIPPAPPANNKQMSVNAEELVKKSLLVGNFEAAVNVYFESGSYADALLLALCGAAELWSETQERYFTQESPKRPFLSIVSAIIRNKLDELVQESDMGSWRETLAILATYARRWGIDWKRLKMTKVPPTVIMCALHLDGAVTNRSSNSKRQTKRPNQNTI